MCHPRVFLNFPLGAVDSPHEQRKNERTDIDRAGDIAVEGPSALADFGVRDTYFETAAERRYNQTARGKRIGFG